MTRRRRRGWLTASSDWPRRRLPRRCAFIRRAAGEPEAPARPDDDGRMAAAGGRDRRVVQPARASAAGRLRAVRSEWQVDRFLGTRPPAGAWLPFGGGVRRCVGAAFAQFEARTVLDELMRTLELRSAGTSSRRTRAPRHRDRPTRGGRVIALRRRPTTSRPAPPHSHPAAPARRGVRRPRRR